ncbi:hypothetical protein H6G96_36955 [Nostoc sp. FACHB-892]|uniref:hypothetical protein n=1 Tax=Nostoc sp. FACHB-892 TaxID=2692843 RepID=UPI00168654E4|nr:hypothetical protein [Nostoc sp. FACHB-892]MBD2731717.1 hypothetical protein [Nostoc sp. FACHB-892]
MWRGSGWYFQYLYERVSALPPKSGKLICMKMKRSPRSFATWVATHFGAHECDRS